MALTALAVALLVGAGFWLKRSFAVVQVAGLSMLPALGPGDRVLARRRRPGALCAGQIVVVRRPLIDFPVDMVPDPESTAPPPIEHPLWIVKRVAATPGTPIRQGWLPADLNGNGTVVPAGMLVLLGDNADASSDSRQLGYFPVRDVLGVVVRHMR
jgi:signal peptidase I